MPPPEQLVSWASGGGLIALIALGIRWLMSGRLIPQSIVRMLEQSFQAREDLLKAQIAELIHSREFEAQANQKLTKYVEELLEISRTTNALIISIQQHAGGGS